MTDAALAYDAVPYVARVIETCNVAYLHAVGRLFGLTPPPVEKIRVLELGCATGLNLLAQAERFPRADFVGLDISPGQIDAANALAAEAEVANVRFECRDIREGRDDLGRFDIVLCHGVLSWVPPEVQEALFGLLGRVLTPAGLVYLSYNALPGWNVVRGIREMIRRHTAAILDPLAKVAAAITLLDAVAASIPDSEAGWRAAVAGELAILKTNDPAYVLHDHFETDNHPFYLHEVVDRARAVGLTYLADAQLPTMSAAGLNDKAAGLLAQAPDLAGREQYLDLFRNRRFRTTLLCRAEAKPSESIQAKPLGDMHVVPQLEIGEVPGPNGGRVLAFRTPSGGTLAALHPPVAALCRTLAEHSGQPVAVAEVLKIAGRRLDKAQIPELKRLFADLGAKFVQDGALIPFSGLPSGVSAPSARPKASAVARAMARRSDSVPNLRHQNVTLTPEERAVLAQCDGKTGVSSPCLASLAAKGMLAG